MSWIKEKLSFTSYFAIFLALVFFFSIISSPSNASALVQYEFPIATAPSDIASDLFFVANSLYPDWDDSDKSFFVGYNTGYGWNEGECNSQYCTAILISIDSGTPIPQDWNGISLTNSLSFQTLWGNSSYITYNTTSNLDTLVLMKTGNGTVQNLSSSYLNSASYIASASSGWWYIEGQNIDKTNIYNPSNNQYPEHESSVTVFPEFSYTVDYNKVFSLQYDKNLPDIIPSNSTLHGFDVIVNEVVNSELIELDTEYMNTKNNSFTYQFEENKEYGIGIYYRVTIPGSAIPEGYVIQHIMIEIDMHNFTNFISGNVNLDNCNANICSPPNQDCGQYTDFGELFMCQFNANTNIGFISPMINSFKNLATSLVVTTPSCDVTLLSDANLPGGRSFNFSELPSSICTQTDKMYEAFPVLKVFTNLTLSFISLTLLVKLWNTATDLRKDNVDII